MSRKMNEESRRTESNAERESRGTESNAERESRKADQDAEREGRKADQDAGGNHGQDKKRYSRGTILRLGKYMLQYKWLLLAAVICTLGSNLSSSICP